MKALRDFLKKLWLKLPVLATDTLASPVAWLLAYWVRLNFEWMTVKKVYPLMTPMVIVGACHLLFYFYYKIYRAVWRFTSTSDLLNIIKLGVGSSLLSLLVMFELQLTAQVPRSLFFIYVLLVTAFMASTRLVVRLYKESWSVKQRKETAKRVLIIGAGCAGERLVRDMLRQGAWPYQAHGFIDDDLRKLRRQIHGVKILGTTNDLTSIVEQHRIDMLFMAMPSVPSANLRDIYTRCEETGLPVRTLPSINDLASGLVGINALREVSLEDLLGRMEVKLNWDSISEFITGKRILVTGGGGSIGSELCRQIAKLNPSELAILDQSECNLYHIDHELRQTYPDLMVTTFLNDVTEKPLIAHLFQSAQPDVVFHAAAYKHVPLLQSKPIAAVKNNVLGTQSVAEACIKAKVKKCILISTDKAVNPTNVMGRTKRLAELICQSFNEEASTQFITVRFGNVLGSAGSVIPLFKKQLAKGGPITVTHPDITRFFMTIPEACMLILQAGTLGSGGEIFVLDMGEPVKIDYLARQLIRLSGKEPDKDIVVSYVGLRPGEKLYEELFYQGESLNPTTHEKILRAQSVTMDKSLLMDKLTESQYLIDTLDERSLNSLLTELVNHSAEIYQLDKIKRPDIAS